MNQDLLLSVQGIPNTFQDFSWYLGRRPMAAQCTIHLHPQATTTPEGWQCHEPAGPSLASPMAPCCCVTPSPRHSGTYQVAVTINPSWTMRAKTEVQVVGECWALGEEVGRLMQPEQPPSSVQTFGPLVPSCNIYWLSIYSVPARSCHLILWGIS